MKREILCSRCGETYTENVDDLAAGFRTRRREIIAMRPEGHGLRVNGEFIPMDRLRCDHCNEVIKNGDKAVAITIWNTHREAQPREWEQLFSQGSPCG